jgi:hypothetical protein
VGYLQPGPYRDSTGKTQMVVRRVSFVEHREIEGIRYPIRMNEEIVSNRATISIGKLEPNAALRADDFRRPR